MTSNIKRKFKTLLLLLTIFSITYISVEYTGLRPAYIIGMSMFPTLHNDQYGLTISPKFGIKRFDIVAFKHKEMHCIKRIVGLPGEKISLIGPFVVINDRILLEELYLFKDFYYKHKDFYLDNNHYLVLGDNRDISMDSRMIGPISKDKIDAVLWMRF